MSLKSNQILVLFLVYICYNLDLSAQENQTRLGLKAGINLSSIASGPINEAGIPRAGILIGFMGEVPINSEISFAPEVVFSHQGNVRRFDEAGVTSTIRTHLNYINVPVLFKYYINQNFAIDLGPYAGVNIAARTKNKSSGVDTTFDIDGVNTLDAGLAGSINYSLGSSYFISARYSRGFTSVFNNTADALGLQAKNSVFNLSFGLYL